MILKGSLSASDVKCGEYVCKHTALCLYQRICVVLRMQTCYCYLGIKHCCYSSLYFRESVAHLHQVGCLYPEARHAACACARSSVFFCPLLEVCVAISILQQRLTKARYFFGGRLGIQRTAYKAYHLPCCRTCLRTRKLPVSFPLHDYGVPRLYARLLWGILDQIYLKGYLDNSGSWIDSVMG